MNENILKKSIGEGVNFTFIKDDRFKTMRISVNMMLPLNKETVSSNAILPFILKNSCNKYPSFSELNKRLATLYGAQVYAAVRKIGDIQVLSLCGVSIDDRYVLNGELISKNIIDILCDIIFDPDLVENRFKKDVFEQEKRQLIETIDAEFNDKRLYAKQRCEEIMCADEPFGINCYGTKQQAKNLTLEDVYKAWRRVLETAKFEIITVGNPNVDDIYNGFKNKLSNINRGNLANCSIKVVKCPNEVKEKIETLDVQQAKLVMGFRTGVSDIDSDYLNTKFAVSLLGGTPHSKLFLNVRERLSLCYYCSSYYDKNKGIMFIQSGVEPQNIEKARKEILCQLNAIQNGDFTLDEINSTKLSLENSFKSVCDYLSGLETWYLSQTFSKEVVSPHECAKLIRLIDKEQIVKAAKKISLDTVYILKGKEN